MAGIICSKCGAYIRFEDGKESGACRACGKQVKVDQFRTTDILVGVVMGALLGGALGGLPGLFIGSWIGGGLVFFWGE